MIIHSSELPVRSLVLVCAGCQWFIVILRVEDMFGVPHFSGYGRCAGKDLATIRWIGPDPELLEKQVIKNIEAI